MRYAVFLMLGLLTCTPTAQAQVIAGTLLEAGSKSPIAGGVVTLLDRDSVPVARLQADDRGAFSFLLPRDGAFRLRAHQVGFHAATSAELTVGPLDTLRVEFSLGRDVIVLDPVVVTARSRRLTAAARRFYDRAGSRSFGTFITRQQIEKAHPRRITELFHRIPGMWITPVLDANSVTVRGNCRPSVYVDGVRINEYGSIDDVAHPLDLEGVEVYRSTQHAPPEFTGTYAGCAVILMWTRIT